jgi:hypothetical protein
MPGVSLIHVEKASLLPPIHRKRLQQILRCQLGWMTPHKDRFMIVRDRSATGRMWSTY